jgi:hypothetical protein
MHYVWFDLDHQEALEKRMSKPLWVDAGVCDTK